MHNADLSLFRQAPTVPSLAAQEKINYKVVFWLFLSEKNFEIGFYLLEHMPMCMYTGEISDATHVSLENFNLPVISFFVGSPISPDRFPRISTEYHLMIQLLNYAIMLAPSLFCLSLFASI